MTELSKIMHVNQQNPRFHNQKPCALSTCSSCHCVSCGTMPANFVIDTEGRAVQTLDNRRLRIIERIIHKMTTYMCIVMCIIHTVSVMQLQKHTKTLETGRGESCKTKFACSPRLAFIIRHYGFVSLMYLYMTYLHGESPAHARSLRPCRTRHCKHLIERIIRTLQRPGSKLR